MGFSFFFYQATRTFTKQIMPLLQEWPISEKETLYVEDLIQNNVGDAGEHRPESGHHPFMGALRSKGFCWFAPSAWSKDVLRHDEMMAWIHARWQFQAHTTGKWFMALTKEDLEWTCKDDGWEQIKREDSWV